MNNKKAKLFRKKAEGKTVGLPLVMYKKGTGASPHFYTDPITHKTKKTTYGIPLLLSKCTRKTYQAIKQQHKLT